VQVNDRPFRTICQDAFNALGSFNSPPRLFVRACHISCIEATELGRPFIAEFDETKLRHYLALAADFYDLSARGIRKEVPPPLDVARNIQSRDPASWGFPVLEAVVEAPTLRPDGTVLSQPGYDAASRLYLVPSPGMEDIDVPEQPCSDHVDVALEVIRDAIGDFPFVDQASYANAVGAILTSVCRHIINGPVPLKPVELVERALRNSSKTRDTVLDPFGGSGTTLIACERTGRQARLIEMEPAYCDVIIRRWQEHTGQLATLEADGRLFKELAAERLGIAA
jgi:hypothetical protein